MSELEISAKELLRRNSTPPYRPIPTFIKGLDIALDGGIRPGFITELVGDRGMGKTTLCIQLCIDVHIPQILQGPDAEALFIDTENSFVVERVKDMAGEFISHCNNVVREAGHPPLDMSVDGIMSGIHVLKCKDMRLLEKIILSLENYLKLNRKIRLVVIDSIAFPFYTKEESFAGRSQPLYSIGQVLIHLAKVYNIAVVLTNNLTTRFSQAGGEYFVPFLGETWCNIPNHRIHLYWKSDRRRAKVIKSSSVVDVEVCYKVTGIGTRE